MIRRMKAVRIDFTCRPPDAIMLYDGTLWRYFMAILEILTSNFTTATHNVMMDRHSTPPEEQQGNKKVASNFGLSARLFRYGQNRSDFLLPSHVTSNLHLGWVGR